MGLTTKQKVFAYEYLRCFNATQAALAAGYAKKSAHDTGCKLLKHPEVAEVIGTKIRRAERKADVTIEEVVAELRNIVELDPGQCYGANGAVLPMQEWPENLRRACSGFEVEEKWDKSDPENPIEVRTKKVKFWSKTQSAELLLRKLKAFQHEQDAGSSSLVELLAAVARKARDE